MSAADFFAIAEKLLDHRNGLRAFLFCYYLGSNKKQVIMFRILKIDDDFVYLSHPDGRLKK